MVLVGPFNILLFVDSTFFVGNLFLFGLYWRQLIVFRPKLVVEMSGVCFACARRGIDSPEVPCTDHEFRELRGPIVGKRVGQHGSRGGYASGSVVCNAPVHRVVTRLGDECGVPGFVPSQSICFAPSSSRNTASRLLISRHQLAS
jgi:hypothetical protein